MPPQDVVAALRSIRESYNHRRQALARQGGTHASGGLATVDKLIGAVDRAIASGEAPIAALSGVIRASAKFIGTPVARVSRGEPVQLLAVGGSTPGGPNRGWWQVKSRSGVTGWIDRTAIFPEGPAALSSKPGFGGLPGASHREDIETGARDTVIF